MLCPLGALAIAVVAMEGVARWVEVNQRAYLWSQEEWLQVLTPSNYVDRGSGRILMSGSSEAREAFLDDRIREGLPGFEVYLNAFASATLTDLGLLLDYVSSEYGPSALPDKLVLGIGTRMMANFRAAPDSLLANAIDSYSPSFWVEESVDGPRLVPKTRLESVLARLRFLSHQTDRYRAATHAVRRASTIVIRPELAQDYHLKQGLTPARYHFAKGMPVERKEPYVRTTGNWPAVHKWDFLADRPRITREARKVVAFTRCHGIELFVINMPELSINRELYEPGVYEQYLEVVREAFGSTPILDLRSLLADDEFFDVSHPSLKGAIKISDQVVDFIAGRSKRAAGAQALAMPCAGQPAGTR